MRKRLWLLVELMLCAWLLTWLGLYSDWRPNLQTMLIVLVITATVLLAVGLFEWADRRSRSKDEVR